MTSVFIGSAGASRELAGQIAAWIEGTGATPVPWYDDVFATTKYTLENLEAVIAKVQGAVVLFSEHHAIGQGEFVANGNVIFEAGLFVGRLGRNRVAICMDGQPRQLSNLDGITYIDVRAHHRQAARNHLERWVRSLQARLPSDPDDHVAAHSSFPIDFFKQQLTTAAKVRILQTFIPCAAHMDLYEAELVAALKRGCQLEVLLCHPRSEVVDIRAESLDSGTDVRAAVTQSFTRLARIHAALPEPSRSNLTVKAYSTLPSFALYQVDDIVLAGNYFHRTLAIDAPQLRTSASRSEHGKRLQREFEDIWCHVYTKPVDMHDFEGWLRR